MSSVREILRHAEADLRRHTVGAEHSASASLWRDLLALRAKAAQTGDDDGLLAEAAELAQQAAAGLPREPAADPPGPAALAATVERAILAPSLHNSQPWRFVVGRDAVEVHLDQDRVPAVADPYGTAGRLACGAATCNLRLAFAVELGRQPDLDVLPDHADPALIARVRAAEPRPATPRERDLYHAIPRRHTNRYPFRDDLPVEYGARSALQAAARAEGCWLDVITDPDRTALIADLSRHAERTLAADPDYRREVHAWTRSEPRPSQPRPVDGIPRHAAGPRPEAYDLLGHRDYGGTPRHDGRDYEPDPLLAVLGSPGPSPRDQVAAGQALQRVLLTATVLGLAVALYSQPVELSATRDELRHAIGRLGTPQLLLRIGYPIHLTTAPRRPAADVTEITC
jgi:nitroreductase